MSLARWFFEELYADTFDRDLEEDQRPHLVVWSTPTKRATWCATIDEAVDVVEDLEQRQANIYHGVCLQSHTQALGEFRRRYSNRPVPFGKTDSPIRGYVQSITHVPGFWLDIDWSNDEHRKKGLPGTSREALSVLDRLMPPTLTLRTGGGLHCYWLFREPFDIECEEEREKLVLRSRGWGYYARGIAASLGYELDATHDLARILRPLGTTNRKYDRKIERVDEWSRGPRYNPGDFEEWESAAESMKAPMPDSGSLTISLDITPHQKIMAMRDLHPEWQKTWEGRRPELPSASEIDLSLASMAAHTGWSDDEIASMLLHRRQEAGVETKIDRPDYYALTIQRARTGVSQMAAIEQLVETPSGDDREDPSPVERRDKLNLVSQMLGTKVISLIRYPDDPPQFSLILGAGQVSLGPCGSFINYGNFRAQVAGVSKTLPPRLKNGVWDRVLEGMLRAAEDVEAGTDVEDVIDAWFRAYLFSFTPLDCGAGPGAGETEAQGIRESLALGPPALVEGCVIFRLDHFRAYLSSVDERVRSNQLARMLASTGFFRDRLQWKRTNGGWTTMSVWRAPSRFHGDGGSAGVEPPAGAETSAESSTEAQEG